MGWLLYANISAFRDYQRGSVAGSFNMYDAPYHPLKVHNPNPPAGWRPWGSSRRDYYWLQDVLRGTTLVMPPDVKIDVGLWRHLALVNPIPGTHSRIDSALAEKLAEGAEFVKFSGASPSMFGRPRMLPGQIYFPESFESIQGKQAYWVIEQLQPETGFRPRTFVLSEALFERHFGSPP